MKENKTFPVMLQKVIQCSTSEGISDKETQVITTVQCKVKKPNNTIHSKKLKLHF